MSGIGILGVGTHLPPGIRRNDHWPAATIERWRAGQARGLAALRGAPPEDQPGARLVVDAMLGLAGDPFEGVVERRVLADDRTATDMEAEAAEQALARAGVGRDEIDLLLVHTAVPEELLSNTACALHARLALPAACLALEVAASAYAFLGQLALAVPMLESGRATRALLVQSCVPSRLHDPDDLVSARVGDAATAVVLGPVGPGRGVRSASHRVDGTYPRALVAAAPGGRWYDGRSVLASADPAGARRVFLDTVDRSAEVVAEALARAGRRPDEVAFFAAHQGTPWLRALVQQHTGLVHARSVDVFAHTAYTFAASIPLCLDAALAAGALGDGDLVLLLGGGTGMTCGATALVWGHV